MSRGGTKAVNPASLVLAPSKVKKRCAVYCRVSSDERLDQEFNSIDAQKEAGHAFIQSQAHEGWIPVADDYDDPGFSGGTMERPALKRLLSDIERGWVDMIVIYKIDRLSRSLADFARMVEIFDRNQVSFSAVTQQINSATSMGRLMLNVLLSFAQFEREVTGERIRDKIAASKRKGLWMGGVPPLGYDVRNRQLVVNHAEAAIVRRIFEEMLTVGSPTRIAERLTAEGITTKAWQTQDGRRREGTRIDKKYAHKILRNRIYRGEISLRGTWYSGVHPPIIDQPLWDQVQTIFAREPRERGIETRGYGRSDALLRGLLFGPHGEHMASTYTNKKGQIYRYYVARAERRYGAGANTTERIPALEIEAATVAQIKSVLSSPEAIAAVCQKIGSSGASLDEPQIVLALSRLGDIWEKLYPNEQYRIVQLMIERVDLASEGLRIRWRQLGWKELITEFAPESIGAELVELENVA
jgi:DNA invertase Pin-like site-specific DNA recombinase